MNIQEAKDQIKQAMIAYFSKDEYGQYMIPLHKQRPIFLIGAPGIGKTAIMEQIAQELNVGLVSYSMTHHTRQSALGLPYIVEKNYQDVSYQVSEYTMSEIISSIYDYMKNTNHQEGILFLDEINCVSETLAPSMLQFLQYKIFGRHQVPEGWIVVTAGNPPEYNKSVKEFDIVTMDRLKCIHVEPDYQVWKQYALSHNMHPAVLSYLDSKKDYFYRVETSVEGKIFVTARGWEDLSTMMKLYEQNDLPINIDLIIQYLQHPKIARDFASYYDLFMKYQSQYDIVDILQGNVDDKIKQQATHARFDERLALLSLLIDHVTSQMKDIQIKQNALLKIMEQLKKDHSSESLQQYLNQNNDLMATHKKYHNLASQEISEISMINTFFSEHLHDDCPTTKQAFGLQVNTIKTQIADMQNQLENLFNFVEEVFQDGQELLILVTELTLNPYSASFISQNGCPQYFKHNKELLFYERNKEIITKLEELNDN
ncbi:MAG: MoxR family ATPase [Erysipelotrichaceae bacterium]|nr:MoxR family ATPase [Erysipelotrichaceae bacterium]